MMTRVITPTPTVVDYDRWWNAAVWQLESRQLDELTPKLEDARWQPQGFIVYRLRETELGVERLHVWLPGLRRVDDRKNGENGGSWHDHVNHVASVIRVGAYIDERVRSAEYRDDGEWLTYELDYGPPERLVRTRRRLRITHVTEHEVPTGAAHGIRVRQLHRVRIPDDQLVITHVLRSADLVPSARVLLVGRDEAELVGDRSPVTQEEHELVIRAISGRLGT